MSTVPISRDDAAPVLRDGRSDEVVRHPEASTQAQSQGALVGSQQRARSIHVLSY